VIHCFTIDLNHIHQELVKVKWSRYRPGVAQRVGRGIALLFHDRGTRRGEWSAVSPGRTLPPGKSRYPFYRRLGRPQGRSGRTENLVPTGIRFRTVQPIVSRYTDWATGPTYIKNYAAKNNGKYLNAGKHKSWGCLVARTTRFYVVTPQLFIIINADFPLYKTEILFHMRRAESASHKLSLNVIPELWVLIKNLI